MSEPGDVSMPGSPLRMRRRDFLAALAGAAAYPSPSPAAPRLDPVIGYLYAGSFGPDPGAADEGFWKGVAEQGYVRGRNLSVEYREAKNDLRRLPDLARDLVRSGVSIIFVPASGPALHAVKAATDTIPVVFVNSGDPISMGFVKSLSRPGENVTGVSDFGDELSAKRLELIKQLVPTASRIGILVPRNYTGLVGEVERAREVVSALPLETVMAQVRTPEEIDAALASFAQDRMDGLYFTPGPMFFGPREQLVKQVAHYRLPAVYSFSEFVPAGGLLSYGISVTERSYEAGRYTGLILNGANPGELPIRRLTKFDLALNLSAARALGLAVPARFLAITDRVVE
jgi:putative tryptophan/tyrosine transport system substrate-binding protein